MTKTDDFKILNDIEHVLLRPNMYVGSTTYEQKQDFLNFKYSDISYVPALFKIVNEVIDNSTDEYTRTQGKFATKIEITIDKKSFTVRDNGRGIPIVLIKDTNNEDIYKPVAAWCRTKAGSNFMDDANRVTGGMNGVGGSLSNIFSKKFIGETSDGMNKLIVKCHNNAKIQSVNVTKSTKKYTEVTSEPDFERFGVDGFDETIISMVRDRLVCLSVAFTDITFKFNGETITSSNGKQYVQKFHQNAIIFSDATKIIGIMPSTDQEFRHHSLLNGLRLYGGGTHIDYILDNIISTVREGIKKKHKFDVAPAQIKSHIQLVTVFREFKNPKFDGQTKEILKNSRAEISAQLNIDYEALAKQVLKTDEIILPIIETQLARQAAQEAKEARDAQKGLAKKKVAKHIAATSSNIDKRILFIAEGDSAIGPFLSVRNALYHGGVPLRGKLLNVRGCKFNEILADKECHDLMAVTGLELGKLPVNLNYGTFAIMTDQDVDGGSIQGLLINFFYLWPDLFKQGKVKIVNSPKRILRGKKDSHMFYTDAEFESFKGSTSGYDLAYIKGLGSLRLHEYRKVINEPKFQTVVIDDASLLEMMYGEDVEPRKKFMSGDIE